MSIDRPALTTKTIVYRSALSAATIYRKVADGTFPKPVRKGRDNLWDEAEFERWIADPEHYRVVLAVSQATAD